MKSSIHKLILSLIGAFVVILAQVAIPKPFDFVVDKRFIIVLISTVFCLLLVDFKNRNALARNAFAIIVILGTAISLIKPVQYSLDEDSHLVHTIGLSDSLLFKYSDEKFSDYEQVFSHDILRNPEHYKGEKYWFNAEHKKTKVNGRIAGYDNPSFLPGAIGWNLGRLVSNKVYISYYLGRFFNVLAYAILVFISLKISKVYQPMLFLMGVLPSAIYVISGFHYDYLYYSMSLISISLLTNVLAEKSKITVKKAVLFQLLSLLFAFSKFPFVLIGTLVLVLPKQYYSSKYSRIISSLLFILVMFVSLVFSGILELIPVDAAATGSTPGVLYFIKHPLPIIRTVLDMPYVMIDHFVGHPLQYVTHHSSLLTALNITVFLILSSSCAIQWRYRIPKIFQIYTGLLLFGITGLMIFAITGDPRVYKPGDIQVGGVQGRYYYFMMTILPVFLGYWISKYFEDRTFSEVEEGRFITIMQYILVFLNIFTVSIGLYTQL